MSNWKVIDTGTASAAKNMAYDAHLLELMKPEDPPILHFYDWARSSITHGWFVNPDEYLDKHELAKEGFELARRPTGGGLLFHTVDFAFSMLVPAEHEGFHEKVIDNYAYINAIVKQAIDQVIAEEGILLPEDPVETHAAKERFCMAKPTIYDVMVGGKKIAGAAQRKKKQGYLHQGSIAIAVPSERLLKRVLVEPDAVIPSMQSLTYPMLSDATEKDIHNMRRKLKETLAEVLQ